MQKNTVAANMQMWKDATRPLLCSGSKRKRLLSSSISVILPVRNLQYELALRVDRLLEILSELSADFEILIIDYGSFDQTPEIAAELAASFPQVKLVECSEVSDPVLVVDESIPMALGDYIFIHDASMPLSQQTMRQLWENRDGRRVAASIELRSSRKVRPDRRESSLHLLSRSNLQPSRARIDGSPLQADSYMRADGVQERMADEPMNPNMAARLRRFVSQ